MPVIDTQILQFVFKLRFVSILIKCVDFFVVNSKMVMFNKIVQLKSLIKLKGKN